MQNAASKRLQLRPAAAATAWLQMGLAHSVTKAYHDFAIRPAGAKAKLQQKAGNWITSPRATAASSSLHRAGSINNIYTQQQDKTFQAPPRQ
jgi:hypothetical protein